MTTKLEPECIEVPLTRGQVALVDKADWDGLELEKYKWEVCVSGKRFYALHRRQRNKKVTRIMMHRVIMQPRELEHVDHINGDTLDNRRCNLRVCSARENIANNHKTWGASKFRGVQKSGKKWVAAIRYKGEKTHLGTFENEVDAAIAYDREFLKLYGEYANPNLPRELYEPGACAHIIVSLDEHTQEE